MKPQDADRRHWEEPSRMSLCGGWEFGRECGLHGAMRNGRLVILSLWSIVSGCGYIQHGSTQKVFIDTVPSGSRISVDGKPYTTPVDLELERVRHHTVTTETKGGTPVATHIRSETQWMIQLFDLLVTPIVGNIVDGVTGGDSVLVPAELVIPLEPKK